MANSPKFRLNEGHLHIIDKFKPGDPAIPAALSDYANYSDVSRQARHWARVLIWMENIFFGLGRHYIDDILVSRLSRNSDTGETTRVQQAASEGVFNTVMAEFNIGAIAEEDLMRSIKLFGSEVLPALRGFEPY